jgi:hypothetical protein
MQKTPDEVRAGGAEPIRSLIRQPHFAS